MHTASLFQEKRHGLHLICLTCVVFMPLLVILNLDAQYFGYNRPEINNLKDEGKESKESKELNEG